VREVHDLHIWAMSTTETALTAHLVIPANGGKPTPHTTPNFLHGACQVLHEKFGIEHATLQLDPEDAPDPCRLSREEAV
jgi:cobalt-zinc-cadmium efflux system protein